MMKTDQTPAQKLKAAGRDLMPIIAVCVSAIVLTLVAVTVYRQMKNETPETGPVQPTLLDKRYLEILARGERAFTDGKYGTAKKEYRIARDLAEKENSSQTLLLELELRLATVMLHLNRPEQAEKHLQNALKYLHETEKQLLPVIHELQEDIRKRQDAAQQKEGAK